MGRNPGFIIEENVYGLAVGKGFFGHFFLIFYLTPL